METYLICLAFALVAGLMFTRLTKLLHLPAVTGYLIAGILIGPFFLGALQIPGIGFNSAHQVETLSIVTQTALGFIAFTIGNEFRIGQVKAMGSAAITIGILQAVITTVLVDVILNVLFFVISGAELDLQVLANPIVIFIGVVYILSRSAGKYYGAAISCGLTHQNKPVTDNLGITLLPQAGVASGHGPNCRQSARRRNGEKCHSVLRTDL